MELITHQGAYTVDTHRINYACPVERPERVTWRDWVKVVGFYVAGTCAIAGAGLLVGYVVGGVL
jgi:hypothetical protein